MELKNLDKLGVILKDARNAKGLTREQLAEIMNITPRYLMSIENENKKPSYNSPVPAYPGIGHLCGYNLLSRKTVCRYKD